MKFRRAKKSIDPNTLLLIKQVVGGFLFVSFLAIITTSVWYVTRLPSLTIATVTAAGGETIDHAVVVSVAEAALHGQYLGLVPKRFAYTYPKTQILNTVSGVERIKDIQLELIDRTELAIAFTEYIPDALWCAGGTDTCVFLDKTGYAFAVAPQLSGGAFLRFEKISTTPATGVQGFDTATYQKMQQLAALLATQDWFVSAVLTDAAGDAFIECTNGIELKILVTDEPEAIVDNLFTVLQSPNFIDHDIADFDYFDLRFGNKVFVKEIEEAEVVAESAEVTEVADVAPTATDIQVVE